MNHIGMIVDLSHVSADTMRDTLAASKLPVMFSHSSCFSVNPHPRNVPEDVQRMLADNDGVQMITAVPGFVSAAVHEWVAAGEQGPRPAVSVKDVADHVEAARDVMGVDHVGVGGDYDGTGAMPTGMEDVGKYQNLFEELRSRGWSEDDLNKLGWRNALRVLEANDGAYKAFMAAGE